MSLKTSKNGGSGFSSTEPKASTSYDKKVDILDITTLIDYILDADVPHINLLNADVDMDGVLGIGDVTKITDYLLKGSF